MTEKLLKTLFNLAASRETPQKTAIVTSIQGQTVSLKGALIHELQVNDCVKLLGAGRNASFADIIALQEKNCTALLQPNSGTLRIGDVAVKQSLFTFEPHGGYLGQIIRADGRHFNTGDRMTPRPPTTEDTTPQTKASFGEKLETHHPIFNTVLPIAKGQRLGVFAGSGVGKTSLLKDLVQKMEYDVAVIALVGERTREVYDWHNTLLPEVKSKSVIVAAPSSASALERRSCPQNAMALARLYQSAGQHVLFICDSLTRLAEAHREVSTALGELPVMRGHPPSVVPLLSGLCEEAGNTTSSGAITAIFSVLVAGSDMEEPVADITRGILDGHVILDRALAEKSHFPAINILQSLSRSDTAVLTSEGQNLNVSLRQKLQILQDNQLLIDSGLYQRGQNATLDRALDIEQDINAFLTQKESRPEDWHVEQLRNFLTPI